MTLEQIVRISLWVTAPFNLLAAYAFAFPESALGQLLGFPYPSHPLFALFSGSMVGLFGVMYVWLVLQPTLIKPVLFFGATGKTIAVAIALYLYLGGLLSSTLMVLISGDLAFAALWFFYLTSRRAA